MVASLRMIICYSMSKVKSILHSLSFILYFFTQKLYETFTNYNSLIDKPFG